MSEFIKLALINGKDLFLSKSSRIDCLEPINEYTVIHFGGTNRCVKETPEEIMALLEGKQAIRLPLTPMAAPTLPVEPEP